MLAEADAPRAGDLDGRGNLSEKTLRQWCSFFIEVAQGEVSFMAEMLNLDQLNQRLSDLFSEYSHNGQTKQYAPDSVRTLQSLIAAGQLSLDEFIERLAMPGPEAQQVLLDLHNDGFLVSSGPTGPLTIGFPLEHLDHIFPGLYPEAATTAN